MCECCIVSTIDIRYSHFNSLVVPFLYKSIRVLNIIYNLNHFFLFIIFCCNLANSSSLISYSFLLDPVMPCFFVFFLGFFTLLFFAPYLASRFDIKSSILPAFLFCINCFKSSSVSIFLSFNNSFCNSSASLDSSFNDFSKFLNRFFLFF